MPIWEDDTAAAPAIPRTFTQQVRAGNALPIISHVAMFDLVLFGFERFQDYYAQRVGYPFPEPYRSAQIANYDRHTNRSSDLECKVFYLDCVKNYIYREARNDGVDEDLLDEAAEQVDRVGVSAFANLLGYPRFDQGYANPLLVLADLPFKTYLTISTATFLEDALRRAGKEPVTKICRWRGPVEAPEQELWTIPSTYVPSKEAPLVYHLCGIDSHPRTGEPVPSSLALTEDDHLEMLVNLSQDRGKDGADRLPALVRGALYEDVVLLGFTLDSWAFRALYFGLIRSAGRDKDRRGVCSIQLPPEERELQEKYLKGYLDREARFDIFWGDLHAYARELRA